MDLAIILKILILICIKLGLHFISLTNKVTDTYHRIHLNQTLQHTVLLLHQFNSIQKVKKVQFAVALKPNSYRSGHLLKKK